MGKPKKQLIIGGQGYGIELVFAAVSDSEYERLLLLCKQRQKSIRIIRLKTPPKIGFKHICCEKDIYCHFKGLPC